MNFSGMAYIAGDTPVHRFDARGKIALLFVYSIAIFFIHTWWAMGGFALGVVVLVALARIPVRRLLLSLLPIIVLAAFAAVFAIIASPDLSGISSGLFVAVRMIALVAASFVVCFTTRSADLLRAFTWFIAPLRVLRVPVDDISFTLSLAIRFIPVIIEEFQQVRRAQITRGAGLHHLSFKRKLQVWSAAFSAVFVGLFRHADALATAMDARCYGTAERRSTLH